MVVPSTPVAMKKKAKLNSMCGTKVAGKIVAQGAWIMRRVRG